MLLFAGETYYPRGGWEDFQGHFKTADEAKTASENFDWAQIVREGKIIMERWDSDEWETVDA